MFKTKPKTWYSKYLFEYVLLSHEFLPLSVRFVDCDLQHILSTAGNVHNKIHQILQQLCHWPCVREWWWDACFCKCEHKDGLVKNILKGRNGRKSKNNGNKSQVNQRWMDRWVKGWKKSGQMDRWMNRQMMEGRSDGQVEGCIYRWTDEWRKGQSKEGRKEKKRKKWKRDV